MDHNKSPRNFGDLAAANRHAEGHNPLCGDNVRVALLLEDGMVADLRFSGSGCAISKSSTSMMTQVVKGKSVEDAKQAAEHFKRLVTRSGDVDKTVLGKLEVFAGVGEFPSRVKCATLGWHVLEAALEGKETPVTTE